MRGEFDRYYTPRSVAIEAIERASLSDTPVAFTDPTCGNGQFLRAAMTVFGSGKCFGLDRDKSAVRALRRMHPSWTVSVGDLLNPQSVSASRVVRHVNHQTLLLLNTPFSQMPRRGMPVSFGDHVLHTSVAMSYLLRSLDLFRPAHGAVAIVPESLLHSDTDRAARHILFRHYRLKVLRELKSTTFSGTRARCTAVCFVPETTLRHERDEIIRPQVEKGAATTVRLVRGALAVHCMNPTPNGTPFIHTTDVRPLLDGNVTVDTLRRTGVTKKGVVSGWLILIPRVGVPCASTLRPILLGREVQISDCLFALECSTKRESFLASEVLRANITRLRSSYRGTGARYITSERLRAALGDLGVDATTA